MQVWQRTGDEYGHSFAHLVTHDKIEHLLFVDSMLTVSDDLAHGCLIAGKNGADCYSILRFFQYARELLLYTLTSKQSNKHILS